jgi:hypothetical protein
LAQEMIANSEALLGEAVSDEIKKRIHTRNCKKNGTNMAVSGLCNKKSAGMSILDMCPLRKL